MISKETLSSDRLIFSLSIIEQLSIPHSTVMEFLNLVVEKFLVIGVAYILGKTNSQYHLETEEHINVI